MRVLLTHHFPLEGSRAGRLVRQWALALEARGHEVRLLIVDEEHRFGEPLWVERVVCGDDPNADLRFPVPRFSTQGEAGDRPLFSSLSTGELAEYRERLRRRLDAQILHFDPNVIHVQHVWVLGQLALESGVPYLISAWPEELVDCRRDRRYRALAEQAAENAGRILADDEATKRGLAAEFAAAAERTVLMPEALDLSGPNACQSEQAAAADVLHALYQSVLDERFG